MSAFSLCLHTKASPPLSPLPSWSSPFSWRACKSDSICAVYWFPDPSSGHLFVIVMHSCVCVCIDKEKNREEKDGESGVRVMEEGALFSPVRGSSRGWHSAADSLVQEPIKKRSKLGVFLIQRCRSCDRLKLSRLGLKGAPLSSTTFVFTL